MRTYIGSHPQEIVRYCTVLYQERANVGLLALVALSQAQDIAEDTTCRDGSTSSCPLDDDGLTTIALRVDLKAAICTTHTSQWRRAGDEAQPCQERRLLMHIIPDNIPDIAEHFIGLSRST